jgi:hypothetical protein
VDPYISRDREYYQFGDLVFRYDNANKWGGVIMQATGKFSDSGGRQIPIGLIQLTIKQKRGEGFCVSYLAACYSVEFGRDALVAISRWIATEATGAFSAFGPERLTPDVMKKAGLTWAAPRRAVPIEFRGTPLVQLLEDIDFGYQVNLTKDTGSILARHQQLALDSRVTGGGSYFVSDVDSDFRFKLTGNEVQMTGVPLIYEWDRTDGTFVKVTNITEFFDENIYLKSDEFSSVFLIS